MSNPRYFELELPTADHSWTGIIAVATAGENLAFSDAVYLKVADSKIWLVNAGATSTMPCIALATAIIAADAVGRFLIYGFMRNNAWSWTPGDLLYPNTTPGNPINTAPLDSGNQVQVIAVALTSNIILFNPSYELVEVS